MYLRVFRIQTNAHKTHDWRHWTERDGASVCWHQYACICTLNARLNVIREFVAKKRRWCLFILLKHSSGISNYVPCKSWICTSESDAICVRQIWAKHVSMWMAELRLCVMSEFGWHGSESYFCLFCRTFRSFNTETISVPHGKYSGFSFLQATNLQPCKHVMNASDWLHTEWLLYQKHMNMK